MKNNINMPEERTIGEGNLNRELWKMRLSIFLPAISMLILYAALKAARLADMKSGLGVVAGLFLGGIIKILIYEIKLKYIYRYSIDAKSASISLVNIFGKRKIVSIQMEEVIKVKYRKKGFWRDDSMIWIHFSGHVDEYFFIESEMGNHFYEKLDVEKI